MNYDKLYTRVNSNEHFHAIKLKELLVDNENKKEKKNNDEREGCEWKKRKKENNKFLHSFNHC